MGAAPPPPTTLTGTSPAFLRQPVGTDWGAVVAKVPGWGCAWSLGWGAFWLLIGVVLAVLANTDGSNAGGEAVGV